MKKTYILNTLLAAVFSAVLLVMIVMRAFFPVVILPQANIPNLVLISLVALLLDHYAAPGADRCYVCIPAFSAVSFGLLPFAACFVGVQDALKLGLTGGIVFTLTTWLFTSIQERLASGPAAKAAPVISALGMLLAAQCLTGLF